MQVAFTLYHLRKKHLAAAAWTESSCSIRLPRVLKADAREVLWHGEAQF